MVDKFLGWAIYGVPAMCAFLYATCAIAHIVKKNYGYGLMWFSYALANVGIIWAMKASD